MPAPRVSQSNIPNFPTPPARNISAMSMPNDLVANGRNYYTEIHFVDYRTAVYGGTGFLGQVGSFINNGVLGGALGSISGGNVASTGAVRLPIPQKVNDQMTFSWSQESGTQMVGSMLPAGLSNALGAVGTGAGALIGKALNPLLFLAFNRPNFRQFQFDWVLAPKTRKESDTIRDIVRLFKNSASPTKGIIMDYPLIAMVNMSPNNLDGLAKFKPMAVQNVTANYTPNPTPSFFENTGAPTIVTLSVSMIEIKIWYRGEIV